MASHGSYQYCVSPEEATATVAFPGAVDLANVTSATLVSIVAQGRTTGMDMLFNDSIVKADAWDWATEAYPESKICVESVDVAAYLAVSGNTMGFRDNGTDGMQASNAFLVITYGEEEEEIFDTHAPANPYPSIMGIHEGKIMPSCNINVSKLYTYPCTGTGGHTKSFELRESGILIANSTWNGYSGDYHNLTLHNVTGAPYVTLLKDHEYNYTIRTGSYPQIIHEHEYKNATGGTITCTKFVDANGKEYDDRIPAIRLWG
jgi:hypothetical protein